jgi:arginyl-tRNA synthetase
VVNLPGNVTMSSREGTVVLLEDLMREAAARARAVVEEKNPELDDATKNAVADAVGMGAIKYTMLASENTKIVTFDWDRALDFNGVAAPYIQYAHVRANSILRKAGASPDDAIAPEHALHPAEVELISQLAQLPEAVRRAAEDFKPLHIANQAYEIARAFNDFYNQCPVLNAEAPIAAFRLRLVAAAKYALAAALRLLAIDAPERM